MSLYTFPRISFIRSTSWLIKREYLEIGKRKENRTNKHKRQYSQENDEKNSFHAFLFLEDEELVADKVPDE